MNHDRIYLFNSKNTFLDLTVGKKWVTESYTDETKSTMMYYATLGQKLARNGILGSVIIVKILSVIFMIMDSLTWAGVAQRTEL